MRSVPAAGEAPVAKTSSAKAAVRLPNEQRLAGWCRDLHDDQVHLRFWQEKRGLRPETLDNFQVGWDGRRYTIPIRDAEGLLVNVRKYQPGGTPKLLGLAGRGSHLFGIDELATAQPAEKGRASFVVVTAGETDKMLASQLGFVAVTGTAGEGSFRAEWLEALAGWPIVLLFDADDPGRKAAARWLEKYADRVPWARDVLLPFPEGSSGKDLTDWIVTEGHTDKDLLRLIHQTPRAKAAHAEGEQAGPTTEAGPLLRRAIEEMVGDLGSRNAAGFWLACQLRDERHSEDEARPVLGQYRDAVRRLKSEDYPLAEAMDSLAQAYSRPPRLAKRGGYSWNDSGNAERLVDRHGSDMRFVPGYGGWHVWTGATWERDNAKATLRWAKATARSILAEARTLQRTDPKAAEALRGWATASANAGRLKAMLDLAAAEPGITMDASEFDADPRRLVAANVSLYLADDGVRLEPHAREHYSRHRMRTAYDPASAAPAWDGFLTAALPDDAVREYAQRLIGYSLLGANPARLMPFVMGPTSTGKSTFVDVVDETLGPYAGTFDLTVFRGKSGDGPRADIVDIVDRRFVYTTEANSEWHLHADVIKRLTGGDKVKARALYSNVFVERVPAFTPWIATNRPPTVQHADAALWRRLVVVPFRQQVDPQDEDRYLRTRLADEAAGILRWAVDGWVAYAQHGLTPVPAAIAAATEALRQALSDVDAFLAETCETDPTYRVPFGDIWEAYDSWCVTNQVPERDRLSVRAFAEELTAREYESVSLRSGPGSDRKVRHRKGLQLAAPAHPGSVRVLRSGGYA